MIRPVLLACCLLITSAKAADDPAGIYSTYWESLTCGRFVQAASFIHPQDLRELRLGLLPLLVQARSSRNADVRQVAHTFFSANPKIDPAAFDDEHVFSGISHVGGFASKVDLLCGSKLTDFQPVPSASGRTTLKYSVRIGDSVVEADDPVEFEHYQGRVYIRMETRPAETIQAYKEALAR